MSDFLLPAARLIFRFLACRDEQLPKTDAIIGFGHFDNKIALRCGELYQQNLAPRIIFTGGVGAGSADLILPEADAFWHELQAVYPEIPQSAVICESASSNTGENIQKTKHLLEVEYPSFRFGGGLDTAILVASPYRQLRVAQSWKKQVPEVEHWNAPPESDFECERELFTAKGEDLVRQLVGEMQRIKSYPDKGFMQTVDIPVEIEEAYKYLISKQ